jgi:co-chaperonin GroES (HSP10)
MLVANIAQLSTASDPKQAILDAVGDQLEGVEVFNSDVLVATFARPEKSAGGVLLPQSQSKEDEYQGKVGLVLKMGPSAFKYIGRFEHEGQSPQVGDWVLYRASDGWATHLRSANARDSKGVHVRFIESENIRAIVDDPMKFY